VKHDSISEAVALKNVICKLQSKESAQWIGFLSTAEFVTLLDAGAVPLHSDDAVMARKLAASQGRPRWYTFTPGLQLRQLSNAAAKPRMAPGRR